MVRDCRTQRQSLCHLHSLLGRSVKNETLAGSTAALMRENPVPGTHTSWSCHRSRVWHLPLRLSAALLAPIVSISQFLALWRRLRSDATGRTAASNFEAQFSELIFTLPENAVTWKARLFRKRRAGRGIVIVAGGPGYGALACCAVDSLRRCGCALPVEVWHLGHAECECEAMSALAARTGVTMRNLLGLHPTLLDEPGYGYAAKPLAIAASVCRRPAVGGRGF